MQQLIERVRAALSTLDTDLDDEEVIDNLLADPGVADALAGLVWDAYREVTS